MAHPISLAAKVGADIRPGASDREEMPVKRSDEAIAQVVAYYSDYDEQTRLSGHLGCVEYLRTQHLIGRYLKAPPAVVLDVGGAAGRYACWLAKGGYTVHLIDPVPLHIQQAGEASAAQPDAPIASCRIGDARQLEFDDGVADAVLLLGPLYHLTESQDRDRALSEAYRALKSGGHVFAVGISRFASTIDGLVSGYCLDPAFQAIMHGDLESGQHRNPTGHPGYFTDTFFHHPDELKAEVARAGFEIAGLLAVEGISYVMVDFDENWAVEGLREFLLDIIRRTEEEPSLLGASPHILCVGLKP
jgi:ubiquinone/menaquinone biosynthesis C-methylase UbiE